MVVGEVLLRYTLLLEAQVNDCFVKRTTNNYLGLSRFMPKGLKTTSSLIVIGATVTESAPNTFTQARVDLQLNPLDNEVFVVQAIDLEVASPDAQAGIDSSSNMTITTTSVAALPNLAATNTMAVNSAIIRAAGFVDGGVAFETSSINSPPTDLGYLAIIATNDFFLQIQSTLNLAPKAGVCKVYGYRARADASVYAALVQSEVLSS